jgi:mRNA interferase MazF
VVVVSDDDIGRLRLRIVVPVTDWDNRYLALPWMVRLSPTASNGLAKPSAADAFQVRSLSTLRLIERLGHLPDDETEVVADAVTLCLGGHRHPA